MRSSLLLDGRIWGMCDATALAVVDGTVVWVGDDSSARTRVPDAAETLQLHGALITPAFVDAHVHATAAGLLASGLDLTRCASLAQCLDEVARQARAGQVLWGHGWDEMSWPEQRPPSRAELDRAGKGCPVYLSRIDGHSAVVSSALLDRAPQAVSSLGWATSGVLTRQAHHHARRAAWASITPEQRRAAQRRFLDDAAARGVAMVHECAGPDLSGLEDLASLLNIEHGVQVVGYWGQAVSTPEQARELLTATGAHGLAGDLFCDGSIGSRTAALRSPYTDAAGSTGVCYLDSQQVAAHVTACTQAGTQAGFHAIGDAALDAVVAGFRAAESAVGLAALRRCTHRVEHLEMADPEQAAQLARWGVVASVQPAFDATWGGQGGMYARRLGFARAAVMNPFALLAAQGMALAFGSDAPVTPVDPWGGVRAAVHHHNPSFALSLDAALQAHTRGGYLAAGSTEPRAGTLEPGAPASYAIWDGDLIGSPTAAPPVCLRTVHRGRILFEREGVLV